MREDRIDRPDLAHQLGRDHLGARAVLGLGGEHEPWIGREVSVAFVIVMIDPRGEPIAERGQERLRDELERDARAHRRRKRDVEHDDAADEPLRLWE